jgi:hypothetical protein
MNNLFILPHLGLGDQYIVSPIVRQWNQQYNQTHVYCLPQHYHTLLDLYRDTIGTNHVIYPLLLTNEWKQEFGRTNRISLLQDKHIKNGHHFKTIGYKPIGRHRGASFDDAFYTDAHIPFNEKWDGFIIPEYLVNPAPKAENYAFVHQDTNRGFNIDTKKIALPLLQPDCLTTSALWWIKTIQSASEIHCIDSSFLNLIDLMDENKIPMCHNGNLFYHYYSRKAHVGAQPHLRKNWMRLDKAPTQTLYHTNQAIVNLVEGFNIAKKTPIVNLHITDGNLGDIASSPLLYFDFPNHESFQLDIRKIQQPQDRPSKSLYKMENQHVIVGGGGLIWQCHSQMEHLAQSHKGLLVSWSAGHNSHFVENEKDYPKWMEQYDLHGIRDFNSPYPYCPDVSCMSPFLDTKFVTRHPLGVYYHGENYIDTTGSKYSEAPQMSNFTPSLYKVIDFLGSCDTILTNTYHGLYWSLLLNKKVIVYRPFSTRFSKLKYDAPSIRYLSEIEEAKQKCGSHPDYLEDCREINRNHYKKITALL